MADRLRVRFLPSSNSIRGRAAAPTEAGSGLDSQAARAAAGRSDRSRLLAQGNGGRVRHWTTGNDPKKPIYRVAISEARRIASLLGVVDPADSRLVNTVSVGPDGNAVSDGRPTARGADWSDEEGQFSINPAVAPEERSGEEPAA